MDPSGREPGYAEISAGELKGRLERGDDLVLLDVREPWEARLSGIGGSVLIPIGTLPARYRELDPEAETVAICHHGVRSAHVTRALTEAGFRRVLNLRGGLDAYAEVDPAVPRY